MGRPVYAPSAEVAITYRMPPEVGLPEPMGCCMPPARGALLDAAGQPGQHDCGEFRAALRRLSQQAGTWRKRGSCPRVVVVTPFRGCSWGADRSA